ncbi:hypothetical protein GYMLUDRAFT_65282 [Collybiopsis luxurians FD-317 M1]|uniref:Uncharacterized protein n=1 Tax=Collybiopsis luxurians FD-317 M1 TaxID=944289 RepID=A0A0D0AJP5_9AGAR|nr:hypothetical protein GYMLUDRAFT_65282 [Collybiopsis luxurians FD-317 M1]
MKRRFPAQSSEPSKKPKTREVLGAFTSNTNGGRPHLKHAEAGIVQANSNSRLKCKDKGDSLDHKKGPDTSTFLMTLSQFAPAPMRKASNDAENVDPHVVSDNESPGADLTKPEILNDKENNFLQDVLCNNNGSKLFDGEDEELPYNPECKWDFVEDRGSRSNESNAIEDVSENMKSQTKTSKVGNGKVLLSQFKDEKLALFAKHCAQVAACVDNMCPKDKLACWSTFKEEVDCLEMRVGQKTFGNL